MGRLARFIRFYTDEDDGNGGEKGVLKTVSGALLHIVDALAKPINKFTATLEPIQDLHGQDAPYPSGGGKNLLPYPYADNRTTIVSVNVTVHDDGTITFNGTPDGGTMFFNLTTATINPITLSPGTYTLSNGGITGNLCRITAVKDGSYYTTTDANTGYVTFTLSESGVFNFYVSTPNGTSMNSLTVKPQLELGSTATAYAPYSNICPITGHTGVSVVRTGKNLLHVDSRVSQTTAQVIYTSDDNYIYMNGTKYGGGYADLSTLTITLQAGTYYLKAFALDGTAESRPDIYAYDGSNNITASIWDEKELTLSEEKTFRFRLALWSDNKVYTNYKIGIVVSKTSGISSYEPYQGTTYSLTFPDAAGTVYGGTLTNEGGEWKLSVDMGNVTLDGSSDENWTNKTGGTALYSFTDSTIKNMTDTSSLSSVISDYLPTKTQSALASSSTLQGIAVFSWGTQIVVRIDEVTTLEALKTYLANNPLQVVYELATPIEHTVTESQALTLLKGENNIWVDDSDDLELQYYAKAEETP